MLVIAGKNQCAVDVFKYIKRRYPHLDIMGIPNKDDDVNDGWQPSFKKYLLKNRYTVGSLEDCYDKEALE